MRAQKVIAVIPAYNEELRLGQVLKKTVAYVDRIVVVDDHSGDDTFNVSHQPGIISVRLLTNMGAGFATRVGCDIAIKEGADLIITLDADGQHDPAEIPKLIKYMQKEKLDILFGSRSRNSNMPLVKRIGNWGLSAIASLLFGIQIKDSQTGYHVFTKEAYPKLRWESNRYGVVSEFVYRTAIAHLSYKEVQVKTIYTSKVAGMKKRDALRAVFQMITWRINK
jgi:glycosyltransferase involved in cell wall biosynthesis